MMGGLFPTGSNSIDGLLDELSGNAGIPSFEVSLVPRVSFAVAVVPQVKFNPTTPAEDTER